MQPSSRFSQRAKEVAEDLLATLDKELEAEALGWLPVQFHLDNSNEMLDRDRAEEWIKESVDSGYPDVRFHIESRGPAQVVINLAAFEDPDGQFYP